VRAPHGAEFADDAGGRVQSTNRLIARVEGGRARLQSRQLRPLTRCFPEIVAALREHFAGDVLLDGEIVVCAPDGRLDFPALTRRIAGASRGPVEAPATYVTGARTGSLSA
jgi:ATP-dependent DNA ligase